MGLRILRTIVTMTISHCCCKLACTLSWSVFPCFSLDRGQWGRMRAQDYSEPQRVKGVPSIRFEEPSVLSMKVMENHSWSCSILFYGPNNQCRGEWGCNHLRIDNLCAWWGWGCQRNSIQPNHNGLENHHEGSSKSSLRFMIEWMVTFSPTGTQHTCNISRSDNPHLTKQTSFSLINN